MKFDCKQILNSIKKITSCLIKARRFLQNISMSTLLTSGSNFFHSLIVNLEVISPQSKWGLTYDLYIVINKEPGNDRLR